jgi:hypothetical protein
MFTTMIRFSVIDHLLQPLVIRAEGRSECSSLLRQAVDELANQFNPIDTQNREHK